MTSDIERRLAISLLLLRLSLGLVMMVWAFDKILNPGHGAAVFEGFYGLSGIGESLIPMIGIAQGLIVLAFLLGFAKTWSYGTVLFMHAVTTLVSFSAYLQPLKNILFFAAWPMLAGLIALFLLRHQDRIASIDGRKGRAAEAGS
jgi:glycerol-3-phosphate acyltransferase PlsY